MRSQIIITWLLNNMIFKKGGVFFYNYAIRLHKDLIT